MRISKFLASRLRRVPARRLHRVTAKVNIGTIFRLFKKGQNARMGKGVGAYLTKRRIVFPGFMWASALGPNTSRIRTLARYVSARSRGQICLASRPGPDHQRLRRLSFRRDRIVRQSDSLRWGTVEAKQRRDFFKSRLGARLCRLWVGGFRRLRRNIELRRLRRLRRFKRLSLDLALRHIGSHRGANPLALLTRLVARGSRPSRARIAMTVHERRSFWRQLPLLRKRHIRTLRRLGRKHLTSASA